MAQRVVGVKVPLYVVASMGCRECGGLMDIVVVTTDAAAALDAYRAIDLGDEVDVGGPYPAEGVHTYSGEDDWPTSVVHGDTVADAAAAVFRVEAEIGEPAEVGEALSEAQADAVRMLWLAIRSAPGREIRVSDDAVDEWDADSVLIVERDEPKGATVLKARRGPGPRFLGDDEAEAGMVVAMVAVLMVALMLVGGLVADGGRLLAARTHALGVAQGAARAGAQHLDEAAARSGASLLDVVEARRAALDYVTADGGRAEVVEVDADRVTVVVAERAALVFLGGLVRDTVRVEASARAAPGLREAT